MFGGNSDAAQPPQDTGAAVDATADTTSVESTPTAPPVIDSSGFLPTASDPAVAAPAASGVPAVAPASDGDDDLLSIKQQALQQLSPLVGHLDQSPEDKFRTTMMMIQAADNQELIKDAFTAAQQITDEKVRAQALLDIINEINYFTQQGQAGSAEATEPA